MAFARDSASQVGDGRGPIPIRNGRAFNQLALQFAPESPVVLRAGDSRLGVQVDLFNNLLVPSPRGAVVREDYEEQRLTVSWREGIGRETEVEVFLPVRYRNGGFMDQLLRVWHRLLAHGAGDLADRNRDHELVSDGLRLCRGGHRGRRHDRANGGRSHPADREPSPRPEGAGPMIVTIFVGLLVVLFVA